MIETEDIKFVTPGHLYKLIEAETFANGVSSENNQNIYILLYFQNNCI